MLTLECRLHVAQPGLLWRSDQQWFPWKAKTSSPVIYKLLIYLGKTDGVAPLQTLEMQTCQLSVAYEPHTLDPNIRGINPPQTAPDWWRNHTQAQLSRVQAPLQRPAALAAQTVTSLRSAEHGYTSCERRSLCFPDCLFTCAPRALAHVAKRYSYHCLSPSIPCDVITWSHKRTSLWVSR